MSIFSRAPRDHWLPDGTQSGAGSTPSHDEAIRRTGANVVANSYRSPQTSFGSGTPVPGPPLASTQAWHDPRLGYMPSHGHSAYGTPIPMRGYNTPSFAPPQPPFSSCQPLQMSHWHTSGGAMHNQSYIPYDEHAHMLRQQQHAYMQSQALVSFNGPHYGAQYNAPMHYVLPVHHHHDEPLAYLGTQQHQHHQPLQNSFEHQCSLHAPRATEPLQPVPPIMDAAAKSGLLRAANKPIKIPASGKSESCF